MSVRSCSDEGRSSPQRRSPAFLPSLRGRGGGYLPKKRVIIVEQKMESLRLSSEKENEQQLDDLKRTEPVHQPKSNQFEKKNAFSDDSEGELNTGKSSEPYGARDLSAHPKSDFSSIKQPSHKVCFYCKEEGHIRTDCPKRRPICHYCKEMGHFISVCPKKAAKDAKKNNRPSHVISYTYRKTSSEREEGQQCTDFAKKAYGGSQQNADETESNEKPRPVVHVPMPVDASSIKPVLQLRSKLMSSDSEMSTSTVTKQLVRSESSEEEDEDEDEMDINDEDMEVKAIIGKAAKGSQPTDDASGENKAIAAVEDNNKEVGKESEECKEQDNDGLQTLSLEIDGCVEFDSDVSDEDYLDCEDRLRKIPEEDEYYGEDGALLDLDDTENGETDNQQNGGELAETGDKVNHEVSVGEAEMKEEATK